MLTVYKREDQVVQVDVEGIIEASQRREMTQQLEGLVDEDFLHFEINMSGVQYIDSVGVGIFVGLRNKLLKRSGTINVINLPVQVERLFKVTRLHDVLCKPPQKQAGGTL